MSHIITKPDEGEEEKKGRGKRIISPSIARRKKKRRAGTSKLLRMGESNWNRRGRKKGSS